jgi:hypothetical protein
MTVRAEHLGFADTFPEGAHYEMPGTVQEWSLATCDLRTPPRGTTCPSDHLPFDPNFGQPTPSR